MAADNSHLPELPCQKICTEFKDLPDCTCGATTAQHKRGCPRFAMRIRFQDGKVVVLGPSEHSHVEPESNPRLHLGPPTDATFANISEDRERSPIPFVPNGTLSLGDGVVMHVQVDGNFNQIVLRMEGKVLTFRPI